MYEKFAKTHDGRLVLYRIERVGVDDAISFAHAFHWNKNGFPKKPPQSLGRPLILDTLGR